MALIDDTIDMVVPYNPHNGRGRADKIHLAPIEAERLRQRLLDKHLVKADQLTEQLRVLFGRKTLGGWERIEERARKVERIMVRVRENTRVIAGLSTPLV